MRILITNDDGVSSPALVELIRFAKKQVSIFISSEAVVEISKS